MDSHCPSCYFELKRRYLGGLSLRCPSCKTNLRYNIHPLEGAPWHFDLGLYAALFVAMLFTGIFAEVLKLRPLVSLIVLISLVGCSFGGYIVNILKHNKKSVPENWPRWVVISSGRKPHP